MLKIRKTLIEKDRQDKCKTKKDMMNHIFIKVEEAYLEAGSPIDSGRKVHIL